MIILILRLLSTLIVNSKFVSPNLLDFWDDENIFAVFGMIQLVIFGVYFIIFLQASKADDRRRNVRIVKNKEVFFRTKKEYDVDEVKKVMPLLIIGVGFSLTVYFISKNPVNLILQIVFAICGLLSDNLFHIHVLQRDLPRPFPVRGFLSFKSGESGSNTAIPNKIKETKTSTSSDEATKTYDKQNVPVVPKSVKNKNRKKK